MWILELQFHMASHYGAVQRLGRREEIIHFYTLMSSPQNAPPNSPSYPQYQHPAFSLWPGWHQLKGSLQSQ